MHEYEFRLVVENSSPFTLPTPHHPETVQYIKPHFRFRNGKLEEKRIRSIRAVYHDGLWFKWVHSVENPFGSWSLKTNNLFLHNVGNYQDPIEVESRQVLVIDSQARLYTFQASLDTYRLVFEWEYGTFTEDQRQNFNFKSLLESLNRYKHAYDQTRGFRSPLYKLNETLTRRPVTCVDSLEVGGETLYAHKLDGIFGLVYSYRDRVKEKWEGFECVVRKNVSLGDGLVFAAERLEDGRVCLLDVYHVRGHDTVSWCRKAILTKFLQQLDLINGYFVQVYVSDPKNLTPEPNFKTDGLIVHNVERDVIYKYKTDHSIDLVYYKGYFQLPNGRIKCMEKGREMENGCVYEISTKNGKVIRKRTDRFKGNTAAQLENVLKYGWHGPPMLLYTSN